MIRRLLFSTLLAVGAVASAQVRWLATRHDFGAFAEDLGSVEATFKFVNDGDKPVSILDARANCGCTVPEFTRQAIAPGDTGMVRATYLANGRPGRFEKKVSIRFSGREKTPSDLYVSGVVIGSTSTLTQRYPAAAGPLRLSSTTVGFGEVKRGRIKSIYIDAYNQSRDTVRPQFTDLPPYITVKVTPAAIPPGEQGSMAFTLQTLDNPEWGITSRSFGLLPAAGTDTCKLDFFTIMTEDFSKLTPGERINAPVASMTPERVDLGAIGRDKPVKVKLEVKNSGKLPLLVRRLQAVDTAISSVKISSTKIKPGKKAALTLTIDPAKVTADYINARVSIITNDPDNSLLVSRITAEL